MKTPFAYRRHLLQFLATSAVNLGLYAPIWIPPAQAQSQRSRPNEKEPALLRIGYQKSAVNLVLLKQQGVLEKRFPKTKVEWLEFPAGPQLLEALSVGSLEFGLTGDSPPVFAQAAGKALYYVGAEPAKPLSSAILVPPDSPIQKLSDLKGKRVALQKGSSSHFLLVKAVEQAGLAWSDIQPIYLAPADARAAYERKAVDAWVIWDPYYAAVEIGLRPRVLATGQDLTSNHSFYLASVPLVEQHPQTVLALFDALTQADRFAQEQTGQAVALIAAFSGLDPEVVRLFLQRRQRSPVQLLSAQVISEQQKVADVFAQLALIPRKVRVSDIVWKP